MSLTLFILGLVAVNGVIALVITSFLPSLVLSVIAITMITEMVVAIYILKEAAQSRDASDLILAANLTVTMSTPLILATSVGFAVLAKRLKREPKSL
jgi:hypothetical protein